jgi:hypothetical protein
VESSIPRIRKAQYFVATQGHHARLATHAVTERPTWHGIRLTEPQIQPAAVAFSLELLASLDPSPDLNVCQLSHVVLMLPQ